MLVGVISDTHGYFHPRVPELLRGVEHIIHAGDIVDDAIIQQLAHIAPVTAVRGNNDRQGPTAEYPEELTLELESYRIFLTHQVRVPPRPDHPSMVPFAQAGADIVVFGHSHIALQRQVGNILFFNPGAAGKRRFNAIPSVGLLALLPDRVEARVIPL